MNFRYGKHAYSLLDTLLKGETYTIRQMPVGTAYVTSTGVSLIVTLVPMGPVCGTRIDILGSQVVW
jgi:hypothetical protein